MGVLQRTKLEPRRDKGMWGAAWTHQQVAPYRALKRCSNFPSGQEGCNKASVPWQTKLLHGEQQLSAWVAVAGSVLALCPTFLCLSVLTTPSHFLQPTGKEGLGCRKEGIGQFKLKEAGIVQTEV